MENSRPGEELGAGSAHGRRPKGNSFCRGTPHKLTYLFRVGDVARISQNEGAELVEILHGSLSFLQGLQQTPRVD